MNSIRQQRGITMWGLLFICAVAVFFAFIFFKLFTPYINDFKVKAALDGLNEQVRSGTLTRETIMVSLQKRFDIDDVTRVDLKKHLKFGRKGNNLVIELNYEARVPMAGNITVLLNFDHTREFPAGDFE